MKNIIIPLLLVALLVPSCKYFNRVSKKEALAIAEQARLDSIRIADSIKLDQERLMAIEQARLDSLRVVEEQLALEKRFKYNIVVGSFVTPQYAVDYAEEIKAQGYTPKIIEMTGTPFQLVAIERHENFSEAVRRLERFQDTVVVDSWLYIQK